MFQHRSSYLVPFTSFFSEDDGKDPPNPPAKTEKPQFDDAQQKHINDLLAAERKSAEQRTEQRLTDEAAAAKKKADEDRERDEAAKRGEFDKVRSGLEEKVTATESERDTLKTENEAITAYFSAQYTAALKELPEVITAFAPADDASFKEKSEWLTKAQEQAAKVGSDLKPGNRPNPKPGEKQAATKDEMAAQMRPNISI